MQLRAVLGVVAVTAGVTGLATWVWSRSPPTPRPPTRHVTLGLPAAHRVDSVAVSADGRRVAYAAEVDGRSMIHLRDLDSEKAVRIEGTDGGRQPFFSPDGMWIAFFAGGKLKKVEVDGQRIVEVCDAPPGTAGGSWGDDGRIVFAPLDGRGLVTVPDGGGAVENLTTLDRAAGELAHGWPHVLPQGSGVLFSLVSRGREPRAAILSSEGSDVHALLPIQGAAWYLSTGQVIYTYAGRLQALRVDLANLDRPEAPHPVGADVAGLPIGFDGLGSSVLAVSASGTIVYRPGSQAEPPMQLVWVTRSGDWVPASEAAGRFETPRLSPDGRRAALVVRSGLFTRDVWIEDLTLEGDGRTKLSVQGSDNHAPVWSPDGRRVAFASNQSGDQRIYLRDVPPTARPAEPWPVQAGAEGARNPASWTMGRLAFYLVTPGGGRDIWVAPETGGTPRVLLDTPANERSPAWSPDGRWLAYTSDVSGTDEVYVMSPDGRPPVQVSHRGGTEPVWSRDGRELFFRSFTQVLEVELGDAEPDPSRAPVVLFDREYARDAAGHSPQYDVAADGRFLMLHRADEPVDLRLILDWH